MKYVDGFLVPVPKKNLKAYWAIARKACKIWLEHGALEYRECLGEDLDVPGMLPFTKISGAKSGETVIIAWIVYKSRKHRDQVNAKVMKDPRLTGMMDPKNAPFDCKRMAYGGFELTVQG